MGDELKEYWAIVSLPDAPERGRRVTIVAANAAEARRKLEEAYEEGSVVYFRDEEAFNRPR